MPRATRPDQAPAAELSLALRSLIVRRPVGCDVPAPYDVVLSGAAADDGANNNVTQSTLVNIDLFGVDDASSTSPSSSSSTVDTEHELERLDCLVLHYVRRDVDDVAMRIARGEAICHRTLCATSRRWSTVYDRHYWARVHAFLFASSLGTRFESYVEDNVSRALSTATRERIDVQMSARDFALCVPPLAK